MTASQSMREIETLPPDEQAEAVRFACRLDTERRLTGAELAGLAQRMAATSDPAEAARLRGEIMRGFYGGKADAN